MFLFVNAGSIFRTKPYQQQQQQEQQQQQQKLNSRLSFLTFKTKAVSLYCSYGFFAMQFFGVI